MRKRKKDEEADEEERWIILEDYPLQSVEEYFTGEWFMTARLIALMACRPR